MAEVRSRLPVIMKVVTGRSERVTRFVPGRPPVDPLQSPCVRNCCLDEQDVCLGCGRTLDEIRAWASLDEGQRRQVLARAAARRGEPEGSAGA